MTRIDFKFFDPQGSSITYIEYNYKKLKKQYPGCSFRIGKHRSVKGIFVLSSKEYLDIVKEPIEIADATWFWGPADRDKAIAALSCYETSVKDKLAIQIDCGATLKIFPASALPRKVFLSRRQVDTEIKEGENPYPKINPYGCLAYELFDRFKDGEEVPLSDPKVIDFVTMALRNSYNLPIEVFDSLELLSIQDLDSILMAAMGVTEEVKKLLCDESNKQLS